MAPRPSRKSTSTRRPWCRPSIPPCPAARTLDEPLLAHLPTNDWRTALETVVAKAKGKLVLAFDEFQWLVGACAERPSILQELWDRSWRASGKVMVILCGSYVG